MILFDGFLLLFVLFCVIAAAYESYAAQSILIALSIALLYYFGWFTFTGIINHLPMILQYTSLYIFIGFLYSFLDHFLNVRIFNSTLMKAYDEYNKISRTEKFETFYRRCYHVTGFSIDFDNMVVNSYYLTNQLPWTILFWWSKLLHRLLKDMIIELIKYIVEKFQGVYNWITDITINNTMEKINNLRVDKGSTN